VLANAFAISAFVLLRKDRPNWPRPIKLPSYWVPIAVVLCAAFVVFEVVGIGWFQIAAGGYGKGAQIKIIGFAVLAISFLLFLFRRIVQEKEKPHWREETPTMPEETPGPAVVAPSVTAT
jgi:membrane protein implicated in regulation of membrane protease activity